MLVALAASSVAGGATGDLVYEDCITGEIESGPEGSGACDAIGSAAPAGENSGVDVPVSFALSPDGASLYVASGFDDAIARFVRNATSGELSYKGCITGELESGPAGSGACEVIPSATSDGTNSGLDSPASLTLSPDGTSLYVTSGFDAAITRFARDTTSGKLSYGGCITGETQSGPAGSGACEAIPSATSNGPNSGIDIPVSVAVSADGASLYAASASDWAVARFSRNTTSGGLRYKGCITGESQSGPLGSGACEATPTVSAIGNNGLSLLTSLTLSPDGASLYVTSSNDAAVSRFSRNTTSGKLAYKDCITGDIQSGPTGTGSCELIPSATSFGAKSGLDRLASLTLSPDGASVYVAAANDDAIARFNRKTSGKLRYKGCITGDTDVGPTGSGACETIPFATSVGHESGLDFPASVAVSADGASLYVAAADSDAVARFKRLGKGALTYRGCITGRAITAATGACQIASPTLTGEESGFDTPMSVAPSPDGASLYALSLFDTAVVRFTRVP